jgi:hypothetical protein
VWWKTSRLVLREEWSGRFMLSCRFRCLGVDLELILSCVYDPYANSQSELWQELRELVRNTNGVSLLVDGDFNSTTLVNDRRNGRVDRSSLGF